MGCTERRLTIRSSRKCFVASLIVVACTTTRRHYAFRLNSGVSLRKTRFIKPHVLFTGIYLLKRLFVGFWVSRRALPFGAAPVFSFFASSAPPRWHNVFSQFAPVVNSAFSVLASGSNFAVKPTHLRRAAYFRSLGINGIRIHPRESPKHALLGIEMATPFLR